jgi:3-oxoadipate enol-lactonase
LPTVANGEVALHTEIDGSGEPVTVFAHGLTNSCRELAAFTPMVPGTKVRFCFRGHGHSSSPASGFRFADFASDLDTVAGAYEATCAVGTSVGAGAIMHLLERDPGRFERMVFVLPAGLDHPYSRPESFLAAANRLEGMPKYEAIAAILDDPDRRATYVRQPWLREFERAMWEDMDPAGLARAIREIVGDHPVADRQVLRRVDAPVLLICREGDPIHPAKLGRVLAELMPNAELLLLAGQAEMLEAIPTLVRRVGEFLAGGSANE